MTIEIEIIFVNGETFNCSEFIENKLYGTICHTTKKENFKNIIKEGMIRHSQKDLTKWYYNSFGYNNGCVCLFDFRTLKYDKKYLKNAITCFNPYYIFILKEDEYKNLIPSKIPDEIIANPQTGYGVPYYECWYKGNLDLNKIKKIIVIKHTSKSFRLF